MFGLDLDNDRSKVREIVSLCPQFDIYWPDLTVFEHVILLAEIRKIPYDERERYSKQRIFEVGLEDKTDQKVKYLSGGMKRRLSIALATIGDPKVIFLDEPTTGLDPVTQGEIMKLINVKSRFNILENQTRQSDNLDNTFDGGGRNSCRQDYDFEAG